MRQVQTIAVALLGCAVAASMNCSAGEVDERKERPADESKTTPFAAVEESPSVERNPLPVYHPPLRGAPARLVGGGTRGLSPSDIVLLPFAPDHTGLTVNDQPTIYWHQSEPAVARMVFTLRAEEAIRPLAEVDLGEASRSGIHRLKLSDHGLRLRPDVNYEWFVGIVPNGEQRSHAVLAGGVIRYTRPRAALIKKLQEASRLQRGGVYAVEGIWYDAIDSLSLLIDENPNDQQLRAHRVALLQQVGLSDLDALETSPK